MRLPRQGPPAARAVLALCAALAVAATPGAGRARPQLPREPLAYVRAARALPGGVQAVLWLGAAGESDLLALGLSDRLELGEMDREGRWMPRFLLPVPSGVTALAAADLDGTGELDLVAGTGGAGSLLRIRFPLERPFPVPTSGFLFGAARWVAAADLDGRPPLELLALNAAGELFVYSASAGGGYRRVWRSPPGSRLSAVEAADLDGDGVAEVALAEPEGPVRLARWEAGELRTVGTAYPWGNVTALAVAPVEGARPLLAAVTDRRLAYVYAWDGRELRAQQVASDRTERLRLGLAWMEAQVVAGDAGNGTPGSDLVLEGAGPDGIEVVRIRQNQAQLVARLAWPGASPGLARLSDGRVAVISGAGALEVLRPVSFDYLAAEVDGQPLVPEPGMRLSWEGDLPLVDVEHLARVVPVSVAVDRQARQAWITGPGTRVRVAADVAVAEGDRISAALPLPPRFDTETGRLYVPFQVLVPLGWQVLYDPAERRLTLKSPWPGGQTEMPEQDVAAVHLYIRGLVQGVGFRDFARREARRLGVVGWVRNLPDGRVEVWAEGPPEALSAFVDQVRRGPRAARVTEVQEQVAQPSGAWADFEIRYV